MELRLDFYIMINNERYLSFFLKYELHLDLMAKISNKFYEMLKTVLEIINNRNGKIFIYHNIIHMSGVLFIQEILLQNNIV